MEGNASAPFLKKKIKEYLLELEPIGKGQFGSVFRAYKKGDPEKAFKYAVKQIDRKRL